MNVLAIDIGGSKISFGIVDSENGGVLFCEKQKLPEKTDANLLLEIIKVNCAFILEKYDFGKIGVNIPGLADTKNGVWVYAPFSGINNFPVSKILSDLYGREVYIENDVNSCAVGEKLFGCCKDTDDFFWVTISNGIGGAIFANGSLYSGCGGNAGEIGHININVRENNNNILCGCGKYNCLEALAAGPGISKRFEISYGEKLTAEEIARAARNGDINALQIINETGYYIGAALSSVINILNPKKIIFGGGVSQSFDLLEPGIKSSLDKYMFKAANENIELSRTALGYNAALIGAAAITVN
ncbi:MAG: ROK family protein [Oscillospiraceae bacterium]|nr:ROK family protein [Oscillospiraceae bacterium]